MRHTSEPALLAVGTLEGTDPSETGSARLRLLVRLHRWFRQQTAARVEDEVVDAGAERSTVRLVMPVVAPILAVPALLVLREPGNVGALACLVCGTAAMVYGALSEAVERRLSNPFWIHLLNAAVFAGLISAVLWTFLTFEHPRPHTHWIVFFVYFLLIGSTGLSDDPRQPVCAGAFSIIGYLAVLPLVREAAAGGSPMALRLAPEFEWVANATKVALMGAATVLAVACAQRGRTVRRLSLRDGLTGLLNRHAFDQCLRRLAKRAEQRGRPMIIAMIDIDHFKELNDTWGHPTGDAVLRWVGAWLHRSFRSTDVVARYGGEEFVVAFLDTEDDRVCDRLERLRHNIEHTRLRGLDLDLDLGVTVSIGVARLPSDGPTVEAVLGLADDCLYRAKDRGRNRIVDAGSRGQA